MAYFRAVQLEPRPAILGEHEPHPVASLAAAPKLGEHRVVNRTLRVHEAIEVERVRLVHRRFAHIHFVVKFRKLVFGFQ